MSNNQNGQFALYVNPLNTFTQDAISNPQDSAVEFNAQANSNVVSQSTITTNNLASNNAALALRDLVERRAQRLHSGLERH